VICGRGSFSNQELITEISHCASPEGGTQEQWAKPIDYYKCMKHPFNEKFV